MRTVKPFIHSLTILLYLSACSSGNTGDEIQIFPLYNLTENEAVNSDVLIVDKYLKIERDLPLVRKIQIILDSINSSYFHDATLEYYGIDSIHGLNILKVNLVEKDGLKEDHIYNLNRDWYDYFQGTTGGYATTTILIESILQRQYKGGWVDGVMFYWHRQPFPFEMDHVKLSGLITRYKLNNEYLQYLKENFQDTVSIVLPL